jgi:hypothetical protein
MGGVANGAQQGQRATRDERTRAGRTWGRIIILGKRGQRRAAFGCVVVRGWSRGDQEKMQGAGGLKKNCDREEGRKRPWGGVLGGGGGGADGLGVVRGVAFVGR